MKDVIVAFMFFSLFASFLGMLTFLIYKDVSGWGWFAFIGLLLLGGLKVQVK